MEKETMWMLTIKDIGNPGEKLRFYFEEIDQAMKIVEAIMNGALNGAGFSFLITKRTFPETDMKEITVIPGKTNGKKEKQKRRALRKS